MAVFASYNIALLDFPPLSFALYFAYFIIQENVFQFFWQEKITEKTRKLLMDRINLINTTILMATDPSVWLIQTMMVVRINQYEK